MAKKIFETSFLPYFSYSRSLASYKVFNWCPAVSKRDDGSYSARIIVSESMNRYGNRKMSWDYFEMDATGLVISSPRGMAKEFNGRIRYTDMDAAVEYYKDKKINE